MTNRLDYSSESSLVFAFDPPRIQSVEPPYSHVYEPGAGLQSFVISGEGFGWSQSDIKELSVGGNPCRPVWQNHYSIRCEDLNATTWSGSSRSSVRVAVNGLQTEQQGVFTVYSAPSISTVTPNAAGSLGDVVSDSSYIFFEDRPDTPISNTETECALQNVTINGTLTAQEQCSNRTVVTFEPPVLSPDEEYPVPFQQITCNDCGQRPTDVVRVDIGGRPCADIRRTMVGSAI